ncbi:hypothetical protein EVAR_16818_1 [Eumeta japonica]|uniref:Uncharacterized protein n=1 Tax=Eumeta variegata TaxID=151549 RepID=A0A4C1V2V4_EUMVA|nr:hypothetical protein EVAR_16818_1 [Eumeta japonica]
MLFYERQRKYETTGLDMPVTRRDWQRGMRLITPWPDYIVPGFNVTKCPFTCRSCATAVSLLLGRIGRWSGREIGGTRQLVMRFRACSRFIDL